VTRNSSIFMFLYNVLSIIVYPCFIWSLYHLSLLELRRLIYLLVSSILSYKKNIILVKRRHENGLMRTYQIAYGQREIEYIGLEKFAFELFTNDYPCQIIAH
jgi:hypothetical protein